MASHFDPYASYSDSSAPRTPSPHDIHFANHSAIKHHPIDIVYTDAIDDNVVPVEPKFWHHNSPPNTHGSLLQELYDHDIADQHQQPYLDHPDHPYNHQQSFPRSHDYTIGRRATFPYVRHDREVPIPNYSASFLPQQSSYPSPPEHIYSESSQDAFIPSHSSSPHQSYQEFDDNAAIKLEDPSPSLVASQSGFYPHPMNMSPYLSPHTGLPVQHTDDAASKETQYLRRRCFNCHTTEPPSWRRSTLNPGKIVCNKCGLYERTHLRPRPLRFDELRAGNKARKAAKNASPKTKHPHIKKEPREFAMMRRSSISSTSSIHSGSGASDWDDNGKSFPPLNKCLDLDLPSVSIYSNGSAPPTSFNSPNLGTFPLSRNSQSPPRDGGIRLPNASLSDLASMQSIQGSRRSHTAPSGYYSPPSSSEYYLNHSLCEVKVQPQEASLWGSSLTASPPQAAGLELPTLVEEGVAEVPLVIS
jgi:GATA-binding protein